MKTTKVDPWTWQERYGYTQAWRVDGATASWCRERSGREPVLVNLFEVPAGGEEQFLDVYRRVNAYMRDKPGYVGNRLHRSLGRRRELPFVNVVEWQVRRGLRGRARRVRRRPRGAAGTAVLHVGALAVTRG